MENKFKIKLPFMKKSAAAKASAKAHRARLGKDPHFDWTIILSLFFVTMVLWLSFGYAIWHVVETESFDSPTMSSIDSASSTVPSLNTTVLEKMIEIETAKSQTAAQYGAGYVGPVDPSR